MKNTSQNQKMAAQILKLLSEYSLEEVKMICDKYKRKQKIKQQCHGYPLSAKINVYDTKDEAIITFLFKGNKINIKATFPPKQGYHRILEDYGIKSHMYKDGNRIHLNSYGKS